MSRTFTDENLLTWEAFASGGDFGLPDDPKIVFHCLSDMGTHARFVVHDGNEADAEERIAEMSEQELRDLLARSSELR